MLTKQMLKHAIYSMEKEKEVIVYVIETFCVFPYLPTQNNFQLKSI